MKTINNVQSGQRGAQKEKQEQSSDAVAGTILRREGRCRSVAKGYFITTPKNEILSLRIRSAL
jgi:hypothetical protein